MAAIPCIDLTPVGPSSSGECAPPGSSLGGGVASGLKVSEPGGGGTMPAPPVIVVRVELGSTSERGSPDGRVALSDSTVSPASLP